MAGGVYRDASTSRLCSASRGKRGRETTVRTAGGLTLYLVHLGLERGQVYPPACCDPSKVRNCSSIPIQPYFAPLISCSARSSKPLCSR